MTIWRFMEPEVTTVEIKMVRVPTTECLEGFVSVVMGSASHHVRHTTKLTNDAIILYTD